MSGNTINTNSLSPLGIAMVIGAYIGASWGATAGLQVADKADNAVETVFNKTDAAISGGVLGAIAGASAVPIALIGVTLEVIDDTRKSIYEEPLWAVAAAVAFIVLRSNKS